MNSIPEEQKAREFACVHCRNDRPLHDTIAGYHKWREGHYLRIFPCTAARINEVFAEKED